MLCVLVLILFFFSSRRRHTRWPRDWSSDVCSSDLNRPKPCCCSFAKTDSTDNIKSVNKYSVLNILIKRVMIKEVLKIGRASCREREEIEVDAVTSKKKRQIKECIEEHREKQAMYQH